MEARLVPQGSEWQVWGHPEDVVNTTIKQQGLVTITAIPDFLNGIVHDSPQNGRLALQVLPTVPYRFRWPFPRPRKGEMKLTPQTCSWSSSNHPAHLGFHTSANQCTSGTRPVVFWLPTIRWCRRGRPAIAVTCEAGWIILVKSFDAYETFRTLVMETL